MTDIDIAVCIPSIGMSEDMLSNLVSVLQDEPDVAVLEIWINNFKPSQYWADLYARDVCLRVAHDRSIYHEFNDFANLYGDTHHLAFLNDDIVLHHGDLPRLAGNLTGEYGLISGTDQPGGEGVRRTSGTRRNGGIRSEAFVVRKGCWPKDGIDERFQIWYGDDDLVWKIERDGYWIGVHEGVYVEHHHSLTSSTLDWVPAARVADGKLWHDELRRP